MADVPHFWRAIWAPTLVGSVAGGAGVLGHFWHRMGMPALLERHLPVGDARCRPSAAVAVRLVVTNLPAGFATERERVPSSQPCPERGTPRRHTPSTPQPSAGDDIVPRFAFRSLSGCAVTVASRALSDRDEPAQPVLHGRGFLIADPAMWPPADETFGRDRRNVLGPGPAGLF